MKTNVGAVEQLSTHCRKAQNDTTRHIGITQSDPCR